MCGERASPLKESPLDFTDLYRRHAPDVLRFALYLSGERAVAEDIVSETFVRIWGARDRVELPTVRAYLMAIARNLYLQSRRQERGCEPIESWSEILIDASSDAERSRADRAEMEQLLAELQEMPEPDRAALILRSQEISYEEIGATLGITAGAARVRVHRARLRLAAVRNKQEAS